MGLSVLLAAFAIQSGRDLSKHVTYESVAEPISRAIADIAKATGAKLLVGDEMDGEIVLLRLNDTPLSDALARIAKVTSGRWVMQTDNYVLVPDGSLRQQQADKAAADRFAATKAAIKNRLAQQAEEAKDRAEAKAAFEKAVKANPKTPKDQNGDEWPDPTPSQTAREKLMQEIVSGMDPRDLAAMPGDTRLVYSTNPTAEQRGIASIQPETVAQFVKLTNEESAQQQRLAKEQAETGDVTAQPVPRTSFEVPAKILIAVHTYPNSGTTFRLEIKFYDSNGKLTYSDRDNLAGDADDETPDTSAGQDVEKQTVKSPPKGTPIHYSPISLEVAKFETEAADLASGRTVLSEAAAAEMRRPDLYEPLRYGYSEAILAVAKEKNESIVADIPDDVLQAGDPAPDSESIQPRQTTPLYPNTAAVREAWENDGTIDVHEADNWLEIAPASPVEARAERADRHALTAFIQAGEDKGYHTVLDCAQFALAFPHPDQSPVATRYLAMFADGPVMARWGFDWDAERLYGLLTPDQRTSLESSGSLSVNSLNATQLEQVRHIVYDSEAGLETVEPPTSKPDPNAMPDQFSDELGMGDLWGSGAMETNFLSEPTEALPDGIPQDAVIAASEKSTMIAKPAGKNLGVLGTLGSFGPATFASLQMSEENPGAFGVGAPGEVLKLSKFKMGTRRSWTLRFQLSRRSFVRRRLSEDILPKSSPIIDKSELPADFTRQVEEAKKMFNRWQGEGRGVNGDGGTPPPG